MSKIKNDELDQ